ncbi:hydantoinase/oxoprolinase family protein [Anaerolineales bacterium HSG24]|nr:hydantoinase/oxoprolinase family protein [Anaerolineales bacterium HSG24]
MRIGIDIGGTFTDFVFFDEQTGQFETFKTLSTPTKPEEAVLFGLKSKPLTAKPHIVHGSTVATNALLERKGAITALITTVGFQDILEIGRQNRPDIYDLSSRRPSALVPPALRFGITERIDHQGQVIQPLDLSELDKLIELLRRANVSAVAVSFLFSFLYSEHEEQVASRLRQAGFFVSASNEVLPEFREYERTSTTTVNAYISPIMDRYLARLEQESGAADFRVMQSNGGSIRASKARREAVRCVLSGPAGGVVGARYVAQKAGFGQLITFDMGGTSTDVSLCDGDIQITTEGEIGGLPIRIPIIDIHTVGAGGGSIAHVDAGGALRVGPESAGANPGPICYDQGGTEPTVTDANLILGRLPANQFLGGQMTLNQAATKIAMEQLARQANLTAHLGLTLAQTVAAGIITIANAHMERALRVISVQRGYDPREFTLVSFGGAGGLHAVELARALNIPKLLIPPHASTLSAFGMLTAEVIKDYARTVMLTGETSYAELAGRMEQLISQGRAEVMTEGVPEYDIRLEPLLDMRYQGQSYELMIPLSEQFLSNFHTTHEYTYGYSEPTMPIEIVNIRLRVLGYLPPPPLPEVESGSIHELLKPFDRKFTILANQLVDTPFYRGADIQPSQQILGPAVVVHSDTTVFIGQGDVLQMDKYRNLLIRVELNASKGTLATRQSGLGKTKTGTQSFTEKQSNIKEK